MRFLFGRKKTELVTPEDALPGREERRFAVPAKHAVLGTPLEGPFPKGVRRAVFGLGCFWGAERIFWKIPGVYTTAVGYAGGYTPNPTYSEVCSGRTGHTEAVLVAFDPGKVSYMELLKIFFEGHDPTQQMRQGNDVGTQYRSAISYETDEDLASIEQSLAVYGPKLRESGYGPVATEVAPAGPFYYAEDYHQQYLHKTPNGYCGIGGTGVGCPTGPAETESGLKPVADSDAEWRERLSPEQYAVLREAGTEPPFSGEYVDTDGEGMYRCGACGNPLFDARTKFHSGTGWPSFTEAVSPGAVEVVEDRSLGMVRTEARCARCHSHLGHVFGDGPAEAGGQRFCMNSAALDLDKS